jgi:hypothetical protein
MAVAFDRRHGHTEDGETVAPNPKSKAINFTLSHLESCSFGAALVEVPLA